METKIQRHFNTDSPHHFKRRRLNSIFMEAVKYPLTVVSAGTGYGKSYAVQDFLEEYEAATVWIQLSERDNVPARFWEIFTHIVAQVDVSFYKAIIKLGFPNTGEKLDQYMALLHNYTKMQRQIIVLDDFHFIEEPSVIRFLEQSVHNMPVGTSVFLVSRSSPHINTANLILKNCLFTISESDLRFTENELAQYFNQLSISLHPDCLYKIMQDTQGWAFAIKLIAHSYQKVPGYEGYSRSAMRSNIFQFMQKGIWNEISPELKSFLTCLSLIDHLSFDLIELLAAENRELVSEMEQLSDYIRLDRFANVYRIHHLFLEFLSQKQENLPAQLITDTYKITGRWCRENGFLIDAISYFEKIGDYSSIVSIFSSMPAHIPADFAKFAAEILDRAPEAAFETVELLVESHLRVYISLGLWEKSNVLMKRYETKFLKIPMEVSSAEAASAGDTFNQMTLSSLYYSWGYMRHFLCTTDDCYDFDFYFEKYCQYKSKPSAPGKFANYCPGPWINCAGSSRKDALEDYIAALDRMAACVTFHFNGFKSGKAELARGELKFYQGDLRAAEFHIFNALKITKANNFIEIMHRALNYLMRIAIVQGDFTKAEDALSEIKAQLNNSNNPNRCINYDISLAWYYYALNLPEKVPAWIKEGFLPYEHAAFTENFGNQLKARYCYMTRNFVPLLSYIEEIKQRESFLLGRVEMLAMEACLHYIMKEKSKAFAALHLAWETASPNNLIMPFIEMGKDMRTLTAAAIKKASTGVPKAWLETINHKAAYYAKRQANVITEYKHANRITDGIVLSPRETEILGDISHGLSRAQIAASRSLSINTVKMIINSVYSKLGAGNLADLIRIALERKLV